MRSRPLLTVACATLVAITVGAQGLQPVKTPWRGAGQAPCVGAAGDMTSHGNGYGDVAVRDAINEGRIDGPRYQVSTLGIVWGAAPTAAPSDPLASTVVRSADEGRAAVRDQIARGADWIKLYPA